MRCALLLGRDHHTLGALEAIAEGDSAIALSRGGTDKTYSYVDQNEDAAGFASGPGGTLVAVADGHDGAHGAECALRHVVETEASTLLAADAPAADPAAWRDLLYRVLQATNAAVQANAAQLARAPAPTTLALALVRPRQHLYAWAAVGDSHVFCSGAAGTRDLGWASLGRSRAHFLGVVEETGDRENSALGCEDARGVRALVLATDGLSEVGIGVADPAAAAGAAVAGCASAPRQRKPIAAARALAETAMAAQREQRAGDNIAVAVLWLGE